MFTNTLKEFEDDPFFSGISKSIFASPFLQLEPKKQKKGKKPLQLDDPFQSMMLNMNKMMTSWRSRLTDAENDPNSHCYTSSAVMSYHNDGKSKPKYMQASTSTRRAPGEIKETCRTYRDSESGIEKMAVGHHIGNRGHEHEKKRVKGSDIKEERRFYELDEDQLSDFEKEWRRCADTNKLASKKFGRGQKKRGKSRKQYVECPHSCKRRKKS